jgi:cell division GTPase FtsZ
MAVEQQSRRDYTVWGILAAGQGGGNIASQFLTRTENPGIDERIVIVNTNDTDIQRNLDRVESKLAIDRETLNREHVAHFGADTGVGNDFFDGEQMAEDDFEEIFMPINNTLGGVEGLLYTVALGGGTGNGSVPYIIDQLSKGPDEGQTAEMNAPWLDGLAQFALAAWPFENEQTQRHFNAVCGLSRLLMRDDSSPNTDMTILASNSRLKDLALDDDDDAREGDRGSFADDKELVNSQIISAIDLFISAGRRAEDTIDVKDYYRKPQRRGVYHATFGTALEKPIGLDLKMAIQRAAENAFVPLDVSTAEAAYLVVRAPEQRINAGDVTSGRVRDAFAEWKSEQGLRGTVGMETLTRSRGNDRTLDVLLVLGGFDLTPMIEESWELYEIEKEALHRGQSNGDLARVDRLEENLRQYRNRLEE